jgi:hypothetical protein
MMLTWKDLLQVKKDRNTIIILLFQKIYRVINLFAVIRS